MAEKIKGQQPDKGQWVAPSVTEFTPNVPGALECLYKATRTDKLATITELVRKAITHRKAEGKE